MAATAARAQAPAAIDTLRVTLLLPAGADSASAQVARGAIMSVEESARVAPLLHRVIVLDTVHGTARSSAALRVRGVLLDAGCALASPGAATFSLCGPASPATGDSIVAWDASLEKFGGSSLNARFEARWHRPMDEAAWRGWLAAKIAWESALRAPRDDAQLARWLASPAARFDGHQGVPLSFGPDGRLRHPAYRVVRRDGVRSLEVIP